MHFVQPLSILSAILSSALAYNAPKPPTLTLLYSMVCDLAPEMSMGAVPTGQERIIIPIIGGTFNGSRISGKILNVGADWYLVDSRGKGRPDTRYNLQTNDGTYIYVQTEGPTFEDGRTLLRAKFEAPINSTYSWMNEVVGLGVLTVNGTQQVLIDMWHASL
ncbi:hypothetical protein HBI68_192710 [Parastagonospora nodorum]|nr:hypothetical protein HBI68_192710 [Parastagonospora nodorum]